LLLQLLDLLLQLLDLSVVAAVEVPAPGILQNPTILEPPFKGEHFLEKYFEHNKGSALHKTFSLLCSPYFCQG
jgi:hypothetical protein